MYRTDRHNNPIAISNALTEWLIVLRNNNIQFELGDKFPESNLKTIKFPDVFTGQEASRILLSQTNILQGWYLKHTGKKILQKYQIFNNLQFKDANRFVQNEIINGIYLAERGDGRLKIKNYMELVRVRKGDPEAGTFYFQKAGTDLIQRYPKEDSRVLTLFSRAFGVRNESQEHIDKSYKLTDEFF